MQQPSHAAGVIAHVVELAPDRDHGYDLIDWLADQQPIVSRGAVRATLFAAGWPPHLAAAGQPRSGAQPSDVAEAIRLADVGQPGSPTQALSKLPAEAHRAPSAPSTAPARAIKRAGR